MTTTKIRTRIGTMLLAALLLFSMGMVTTTQVAHAANEGTLNIHKLDSKGLATKPTGDGFTYWESPDNGLFYKYLAGATYTAYKIGTLDQTTATPISVSYTPIAGLKDTGGVAITTLDKNTKPNTIDTTGLDDTLKVTTTVAGPAKLEGLEENGVYLIKETVTPAGVNAATNFIISVPMYVGNEWVYTIDAFPKNVKSDPSIEKTMTGADANNVVYKNVGDKIPYTIKVKIPNDYEAANYSKLVITDIASSLLARDISSLKIVLTPAASPGTPMTLLDNKAEPLVDLKAFDVNLFLSETTTLTATKYGLSLFKNDDTITITYDATISAGQLTSQGGIKNSASLDLGLKDPIKPTNPDPVVKIYSYGIKKVDAAATPAPLAGATFKVATEAGGVYTFLNFDSATSAWANATSKDTATEFTTKVTGTGSIDAEAILQFRNLKPDTTYYLFETTAPTGYITLPKPIAIKADSASTDKVYASYTQETDGSWKYQPDKGYSISIVNTPSSNFPGFLPSTGGLGTFLFIALGAILISGATVLYMRSRRRSEESTEK